MSSIPEATLRHRDGGTAAGVFDPISVRMREAERISGFSRSEIYRRAARPAGDPGRIVLRKSGASTLVDVASLRSAIAALPLAAIGTRKAREPEHAAA